MTKHVVKCSKFLICFLTRYYFNFCILQANDLEETIKRIQSHKGVLGMMIVNNDGKFQLSRNM